MQLPRVPAVVLVVVLTRLAAFPSHAQCTESAVVTQEINAMHALGAAHVDDDAATKKNTAACEGACTRNCMHAARVPRPHWYHKENTLFDGCLFHLPSLKT